VPTRRLRCLTGRRHGRVLWSTAAKGINFASRGRADLELGRRSNESDLEVDKVRCGFRKLVIVLFCLNDQFAYRDD